MRLPLAASGPQLDELLMLALGVVHDQWAEVGFGYLARAADG